MTEIEFWDFIQQAHDQAEGDMNRKCELIKKTISEFPRGEAIEFLSVFDARMNELHIWPVFCAARIIGGGCTDEQFAQFRASVISRGRDHYLVALKKPDDLSYESLEKKRWFFNGFEKAINEGVKAVVGNMPKSNVIFKEVLTGRTWNDSETELKNRYPKLWVKYCHLWQKDEDTFVEYEKADKPWWKFW